MAKDEYLDWMSESKINDRKSMNNVTIMHGKQHTTCQILKAVVFS